VNLWKKDEYKLTGFFDKNTDIKGDLNFKGSFRIDGRFSGKINSDSVLIVGDNGKVEADIIIGTIIINGEVNGTVQAKEKVEINARGRVLGKVITPKLAVEEGAYLDANCQITDQVPKPEEKEKIEEILQSLPDKNTDPGYQT
jgi:cytoskeletal protein CcmA (bactofilin family)